MSDSRKDVLDKIGSFAKKREDIKLAVVIGSQARMTRPADQWSDIDVALVSTSPEMYLNSIEWLKEIGEPMITFLERTSSGGSERRALFNNGVDVDFSISSTSRIEDILARGFPPNNTTTLSRGAQPLEDKENLWPKIEKHIPPLQRMVPPTEHEYHESVNDFLYHWVWTARKLQRGEMWTAIDCCDSYMKTLLLLMIQWNTRSIRGWDYDTWHNGRFLEEWADKDTLQDLKGTFAHYSAEDIIRALANTVNLYCRISKRVAAKMHFQYPRSSEEFARSLVNGILDAHEVS